MTQQVINVGIADKGNGDPIRTAFVKANNNFTELYSLLNNASTVSSTPPNGPNEGELWWDTNDGNLYIYYNGAWAPASVISPNLTYTPTTALHWTAPVTTVADALDQLAARLYAIENP